jgi:hypothetical protein
MAPLVAPISTHATNITWTNTVGGNWSVTNNWSPNQVPGISDTAIITNSGTYTVTVTTVVGVSNVFLGSSSGTQALTLSSGSLNATNISTQTTNGAITLAGGTIANATINLTNGTSLIAQSGTFNGVTMSGTLDVGNSVNAAGLTVTNGLVLNGTALEGNPTNSDYGDITFAGSQTLGGTGTVVFGNQPSSAYNALRLADGGTTLTIGSGITVEGQNGTIGYSSAYGGPQNVLVVNQGLISADVSGGTISIQAQPFINEALAQGTNGGSLTINVLQNNPGATLIMNGAGSLSLSGVWTNAGAINATNVTVNLGGSFTLADLGAFTRSGGTVNLTGVLTNTGTTLALNAASGSWVLDGGTVLGGTITTATGVSLVVNNGTFNGVTMSGTLDVGNSVNAAGLTVTNGLVLNGTALEGNPTNSDYGDITFAGSQTLGGTGTVVFGNQPSSAYNALRLADGGTTLTIGSGITVEGQNGTIGYSSAYGGPQNVLVVNQGLISADVSGGTISIQAQPFINEALAQGTNGGSLTINVLQNNPGATLIMNGAGSLSLSGVWTNAGAINATNVTVNLGGSFTLADLGAFTRSGGTVNLTGVLTNTGTTLALNAASGSWVLDGGTVLGGTITTATGVSLVVNNGTFNGVTMSGTLDVGNSVNAAGLTVTNGLVLNGTALEGNPTNSDYGDITFAGSQTLGGTGTVVFGNQPSSAYNALRLADGGTTLTIGSGITVEGQNGTIGYSSAYGGPQNVLVVNQGLISADVSGGTISIQAQPFINEALAQGTNGGSLTINVLQNNPGATLIMNGAGSLSLSGVWTNAGAINATNVTVNLGGSFTLADLGAFTRSGGTVNLTGVLTNTGTTLALNAASGSWVLDGGTVLGGTITTATGVSLVVNNGTFNGVTMSGTLDVGNSVNAAGLTVTNGLVLNGTALEGNPTNSDYGDITFAGSQTLGGTGTVVFGNQPSSAYNALRLADGGTTLTIGSGITVEGQNGTIGYSSAYGGPQNVLVVNQGLISADVSGGTILVDAEPFDNNGTLAATLGTAALDGSFNLASGTLEFGLSNTNTFGKIQISGSAALAGTVAATLLNGFMPAVSNSFPVLTYGSFTGAFTNTELPSGFVWQTNYGPTTFTLTVSGMTVSGISPVLKPILNPLGQLLLQFTGSTNAEYTVLASTNLAVPLSNWVTLGNASVLSNTLYQFIDTNSTNFPARFYMLRSP